MASGRGAQLRVGLLAIGAALVLMAGLFMIGEQNKLFTSKNRYTFTVDTAGGLNEGNPVRLNGVNVGIVEDITLPGDVRKQQLTVRISIERQYEARIRADSQARIRTIGLLGDKYVDVSSGSPSAPMIPPGGSIPTAPSTDVDKLLASGGDVVDNMVRISYALSHILERVDRGEGLVGELTTGQSGKISDRIDQTLASAQRVIDQVEHGRGALGRMVSDRQLGDQLANAVGRLQSVLEQADRGDGMVATLLRDPAAKADFQATLTDLKQSSASLRAWTKRVESNDTLMNKVMTDEAFGQRAGKDLESIIHDLSNVAAKLDRGEGSAAKLINDPAIYDAVNDIIVGVKDSKMLGWLIRNRQKKGIEIRYNAAQKELAAQGTKQGAAPAATPSPTPPP